MFLNKHKEQKFSAVETMVYHFMLARWNGFRRPKEFEVTLTLFADELGITKKTLIKAIASLESRGVVIKVRRLQYAILYSFNIQTEESDEIPDESKRRISESQKCNNYTSGSSEVYLETSRSVNDDPQKCNNYTSAPYNNKRLLKDSLSKRGISERESIFLIRGKEDIHKVAQEWYIDNRQDLYDTSGDLSVHEFQSIVKEVVSDIKIKNKPYKSKDELTSHLTNLYRRKLEDFFKRHKYD